jgi:hypothetical protein
MTTKYSLLISLLCLSACVRYQEPPPALSVEYGTYSCNGSRQFVAEFQHEAGTVAFVENNRTRMLAVDANGTYTDGTYSLTGAENMPITVYEDGVPVYENCRPVTTQRQYYRKDDRFRPPSLYRDLD